MMNSFSALQEYDQENRLHRRDLYQTSAFCGHVFTMKLLLKNNKANLRDLIAATGLVILHKLDLNHRFFSPCDLEIWWMTINKANLRDLIAATGLVISNWIQIVNFSAHVTVKFDGWPCKTIGHLFYATSSFVHHFVPIGEFKLKLQSGNAQSGSNWMIFRAVRPWNLTVTLQYNRAPLLCYFKLCASFRSHWWIQTSITVGKRPIWVKFDDF